MAEPEPQFGDIYKGTPEGLEQVLFELRNTVYTDPLRRPSYAPREQAVQTPIAYNPFYGIPKKTANWDGNLFEAATLVNDLTTRVLYESLGFRTIKFDTNEPVVTADDYFKDKSRADYIRKQVGGEEVYNNWLEGRYNHIKDYNSLMNRFSYDLAKANAAQALAQASGTDRVLPTLVGTVGDPIALALSLIPFGAPARVASVAENVSRVAAGAFVGSAVYEGARNLTNEVYNTQDFDANDTVSNLVMGTVGGTLVGNAINYRAIGRAARLNRLATTGVTFTTRGVFRTPFSRAGIVRRENVLEELDNLIFTSDEAQEWSQAYQATRQQAVESLRSRGVNLKGENAEQLVIDEVENIVKKRYDDLKDTEVTVTTKYDETTNTFDIEETYIDKNGNKQTVRKTKISSLDDPQIQKELKDVIRKNLEVDYDNTISELVNKNADEATLNAVQKPTDNDIETVFKEKYGKLDAKDTFFISNDARYDFITNKTQNVPKIFRVGLEQPLTLDNLSEMTKTPRRISIRQSLVGSEKSNVSKFVDDESVGILEETRDKTLAKLTRNPTLSPIKWAQTFVEEFWDNLGERVGFIDKKKLTRLKQLMRSEERGDIEFEKYNNIVREEGLSPISNRALYWKLGGMLFVGGALGFAGIKNRSKIFDWLVNDTNTISNIQNGVFDLTQNYMTPKERENIQTMSRGLLGDMATHNKLMFAAQLLQASTPDFAYARELDAIREARKAMTNPLSDFTSLNLRLNAILNSSLQEQRKQNKDATRRAIVALGQADAFDEAVDQLVDISLEMKPHLDDFASKLAPDLAQSAVQAIQASMNNQLRQTIGSYDRQVNAFFAEVVARMGNDGNEFLYASTRIRKSLGMIENGLLNGIDNNGEAYSSNTIIQALGAGMIAKLENPDATGDDIQRVLLERADLTDIESYFLTIGYNLLDNQGKQ